MERKDYIYAEMEIVFFAIISLFDWQGRRNSMSIQSCWIAEPRSRAPLTFFPRACVLLATLYGPLAARAQSEPTADDLAWVEEIVLRPNFVLKESDTGTRRWPVAPKLTVVGGTKDQQKIVADVVEHLNETLKQTPLKGIELLKPNNPAATLPVFIVRRSAIPTRATDLGVPEDVVELMTKEKWSNLSWTYWDPANNYEIRSGFVVVSSDKAGAEQLRCNLLQDLCYDLGFTSYSKRQPKSVFYRDGAKRSGAEKLTDKDQQLIIWFYNHVPAGTKSVEKLYEQHWPKDKR
jgi:hypothetical protein